MADNHLRPGSKLGVFPVKKSSQSFALIDNIHTIDT